MLGPPGAITPSVANCLLLEMKAPAFRTRSLMFAKIGTLSSFPREGEEPQVWTLIAVWG